jgi:hypothetical protein
MQVFKKKKIISSCWFLSTFSRCSSGRPLRTNGSLSDYKR